VLEPVHSASRRMVELSLHYRASRQIASVTSARDRRCPSPDVIAASPRMIAFIDAAPGTMFLPQAAEFKDGHVETFFGPLAGKLNPAGGTLPAPYPQNMATDEGRRQRDEYWNWFARHWNADKAVKVIDEVIGAGGRPAGLTTV
jgi:hypothetical protein